MREKVKSTISKNKLFLQGQTVLVAVSGGPDSLCLLHLLHRMSDELGIFLHVAHINHGLREEAAAEAVAVKKMSIQYGVPVSVCRVNVKAIKARTGQSTQVAARMARYGALLSLARRIGAQRIVTAHHLDDRVETLLMRLLTGSGLDGLASIPIRRKLSGNIEVIRPLFDCSREEIEQYCRNNHLTPLMDPSNLKLMYLRNRVRLKLVPFLEAEFGPSVRQTLANTVETLALDAAYLEKLGNEVFAGVTENRGEEGLWLDIIKLQRLPIVIQARVIRQALWQAGVKRPGRIHVEQVRLLVAHQRPSAKCTLPDGVMAERLYQKLWLGKIHSEDFFEDSVTEIQIPGQTLLPCCGYVVHVTTKQVGDIDVANLTRMEACLDAKKLSGPLLVRSRRDGDRMHPLGAAGSRKIKKILADKKIPQGERDRVPLFFCDGEIVWLGGVEIADEYKVTLDTEDILYLKLIPQ